MPPLQATPGGGHIVILRAVCGRQLRPRRRRLSENRLSASGDRSHRRKPSCFINREASFDPRVIAALRAADGIFLAGGDQGNYVRYWKGTPVQDALNAHVLAGHPIGGSSAGLAILGHYSYTALDGGSMESKTALLDPYNSGVTLEGDFLHIRWLESVITDTHFSKRCRLGRLIVFVARINQQQPADRVFGVGIDEKSALLIGPDGVGRLAAGSAGSAWAVMPQQPAAVLAAGRPLTMEGIRIIRLDQGSSLDFKTREVSRPAAETADSIAGGAPLGESIASPIMLRNTVPKDEG